VKVAIGSDHAGFELKEFVKARLVRDGHIVEDLGTGGEESVDYPDFAFLVSGRVTSGAADRGVLVCGTGIGMSIAANRVKGIRAALVNDLYTAIQSRLHLDANVLVLGGRVLGKGLAEEIVRTWFATAYEGGRHQRRIEKIDKDADRT
jgi:ribose 5-phosphate isomerase B